MEGQSTDKANFPQAIFGHLALYIDAENLQEDSQRGHDHTPSTAHLPAQKIMM